MIIWQVTLGDYRGDKIVTTSYSEVQAVDFITAATMAQQLANEHGAWVIKLEALEK